ncbi:uncharacterized protein Z518_04893 [Rhinocladiella mackenziei CBS 650.93]|uniref:Uncharacterized protein n=1 Tax=Rhinocladiella mackenziei CBS 650.93 TaxID=1442369 RepID=A0A0D2FX53_9EURO|nr:uncharacterized protein Z518_04893 [Rhinocladiella mackenziei CBS 650.93]KIX06917.1 hypothetical protein Z518_04893 [Rhinocladiella mackenziei CBS 650.93]
MKQYTRTIPIAALLAASANGQTTSVVGDLQSNGTTTVTHSVCPTALTTTTSPSTITYCPGLGCNGGGPRITPPSQGPYGGSEVLVFTTTGPDGNFSEYREFLTVYDQICPAGACIKQATCTIMEECPCHVTKNPSSIPSGFTTTVVACDVCANGGPTVLTLTTPCATGPYATVTPDVDSDTGAGTGADTGAGTGAGSGSGSVSDSGSDNGSASGVGAGSRAGSEMGAGAKNNTISPPITPVTSEKTAAYMGGADKTPFALSAVLVIIVGCLPWTL